VEADGLDAMVRGELGHADDVLQSPAGHGGIDADLQAPRVTQAKELQELRLRFRPDPAFSDFIETRTDRVEREHHEARGLLQYRDDAVGEKGPVGLDLQLAAVLVDAVENGFDMRIEKGISLAVELHLGKQREECGRDRLETLERHVTPQDADLVEELLAAADLAAQIAFVGEGEIGRDRGRDLGATPGEKIATLGVEEPGLAGKNEPPAPKPASGPLQGRGKQSQGKTGVQGGVGHLSEPP